MGLWKSEDNLHNSVLFFYHVGSGHLTQLVRLGSKLLCPVSHLASLLCFFSLLWDLLSGWLAFLLYSSHKPSLSFPPSLLPTSVLFTPTPPPHAPGSPFLLSGDVTLSPRPSLKPLILLTFT